MFRLITNKIKIYLINASKRKKWKNLNSHNFTFLELIPDDDKFFKKVIVGKKTYGPIHAIFSGTENEMLTIGNYCSIGSGTKFILGSEHSYKSLSTFPFKVKLLGFKNEAKSKGPIIVEDDVWIGEDCLILSGVKIGQGAVLAASSVIVKDVAPYSIVGGNPAKLIKYRFSEHVISKMIQIDWKNFNEEFLKNDVQDFYLEINESNIDDILSKFKMNINANK